MSRHLTCSTHDELPAAIDRLLVGDVDAVSNRASMETTQPIIFPGSFDPLHDGHVQMSRIATETTGSPVQLEISITNVDKPPLDRATIVQRVETLRNECFWLTRATTFLEKSELFVRPTFVVGIDTILRVGDDRYYENRKSCREAVETLAERECRFLVFGREIDGQFQTLRHIELPAALYEICIEVTADEFRSDHSSSAIRRDR